MTTKNVYIKGPVGIKLPPVENYCYKTSRLIKKKIPHMTILFLTIHKVTGCTLNPSPCKCQPQAQGGGGGADPVRENPPLLAGKQLHATSLS